MTGLCTEKKVEPKLLHPETVLKNGATLKGGAVFFLKVAAGVCPFYSSVHVSCVSLLILGTNRW